jgi:hypothetical protein
MAKSTNDRILRILKEWAGAEPNGQTRNSHADGPTAQGHELKDQIRRKWDADTHVIASILREFCSKMTALNLELTFEERKPQGSALAVGYIGGSLAGHKFGMYLNIHPHGDLHVFQDGHPSSLFHVVDCPTRFSILTADKRQYEALILEHIEAEIPNRRFMRNFFGR